MTNLILAAMLTLTAGGQTPATTTVNAAGTVNQTARTDSGTSNGGQRVCVRQQDGTGTILSRTICRTREEWQRNGGLPSQSNR